MTVNDLNKLDTEAAAQALQRCCVSTRWVDAMVSARPYPDSGALRSKADFIWSGLGAEDYLEAFEGHPKIGDVSSLKAKYASSGNLAAHEQASVASATETVIERLADGNKRYEQRFGYIFIVCATGKTATEMCELLEARLHNEPEAELIVAAEEQRKILQIRLEQWQ